VGKCSKEEQKAMMQFVLSFQKVAQLNKLNCACRADKDWPPGKVQEVMTEFVKEYESEDTMAKMEMEKALAKVTFTRKKDPKDLMDKLPVVKRRYIINLSESKKNAKVFRVDGTHYASVISTTQMIWREKEKELTYENLIKEMHIQWQIAGNNTQEEKDSNDENEVAAIATQKGGKKKAYSNPNKDKTCNRCKKKGHGETKCWKEHPELIPDKVKAAR
jgi:hypothetical protein